VWMYAHADYPDYDNYTVSAAAVRVRVMSQLGGGEGFAFRAERLTKGAS